MIEGVLQRGRRLVPSPLPDQGIGEMAAADGAVGAGQADRLGHCDAVPGPLGSPLVLTEHHEHHGFREDGLQPHAVRAEPDGGFLRLGQVRQLGSEIAPPHAASGEHDERQRLGAGVTGCTRDIERFGRPLSRRRPAPDGRAVRCAPPR